MRIKTSVENSQIALRNIELDFSNYGIYIISGENGCGKTSIIKNIVFNEKQISFNDTDVEAQFEKDRSNTISYVEQDPNSFDSSLYKYVSRYSNNISNEKINYYLSLFGMENEKLNRKISELSGGELIKVNIISSLLKDCPYIFMDEPTNNLDNESVRSFVKIIEEYSKNHTVIIVSHDPRMLFSDFTEYRIENNNVKEIKSFECINKNKNVVQNKTFPAKNIMCDYLFSLTGLLNLLFILLSMFLICFLDYVIYCSTMVVNQDIQIQDVIVGYKVDEQYDELNKIYTESENIQIDEEQYYRMIYFNDLKELVNDELIENIILPDIKYINSLNEKIRFYAEPENKVNDIMCFSVPNVLIKNFAGQITLPYNCLVLKKGRLPNDNSDEVVISEKIANEYFGFENSNIIGMKVKIENKEYTVVGIGYSDIAIVSYNQNDEYGYFSIIGNEEKLNELNNFFVEKDYFLTEGTSEEIFIVKKGYEKEILNSLIKKYPAENYASHEFEKVFTKSTNEKAARQLYLFNVFAGTLLTSLVLIFNWKRHKISKNKIVSIDNFYCKNSKTLKVYREVDCFQYLISSFVVILSVTIFQKVLISYVLVALGIGMIIQVIKLLGWNHK